MSTTKTPLIAGESITFTTGRITITLQCVFPENPVGPQPSYTVTTYDGTLRLETWCRRYDSEKVARDAATRAALAFRAHGSLRAIEARMTELTRVIHEQSGRRGAMRDRALLERAETEYDSLMSLTDLALLDDLREHVGPALAA